MKKIRSDKQRARYIRQACSWMLLAAALSGCARQPADSEKTSIRIGMSLYQGDDTFINNIRNELEQEAKAYEQKTGIKVNLDIQDAKGSQHTQNSQVERFISLGCDVLCINPVDRMDASAMIDQAMTADVPVVFFNRQPVEEDMNRWDQLYYLGVDPKESGVLQAAIVEKCYKETPEKLDLNGDGVVSYVLLEGESSHQDALIRTEWVIQTLKDSGVPIEKITGGIANWERSQASALMEQWLNKYPGQIELVICNNDGMALGAIDAIERAGLSDIKAVGIDGVEAGVAAVEEGTMIGTVSSNKEQYARVMFSILADKAMGRELDPELQLENGKYYRCPQEIIDTESLLFYKN